MYKGGLFLIRLPGSQVRKLRLQREDGVGVATQAERGVAGLNLSCSSRYLPPVCWAEVRLGGWPHDLEAYTCQHLPRLSSMSGMEEQVWTLSPCLVWWGPSRPSRPML